MPFFYSHFQRFIASTHAFYWLVLLGLVLVLPSLFSGFLADDFSHAVLINHPGLLRQPDNLSFFHLFTFITGDVDRRMQLQGLSAIPWWTNANFSLVFWRPLAELTHYVDYALLKFSFLMHLHSLLWYAVLLVLIAKVYQTFCSSRLVAILAFLLFVVDATHGFTVAWLANRNALMAAVFSLVALLSHHKFRESAQFIYLGLSLVAIACSFLSAEAGISVGILLLAYAVFLDKNRGIKSLAWLLPALLVFLLWAFFYIKYHYGAFGNKAYYVDLLSSPIYYLDHFVVRFPVALAMQFNVIPLHFIGIQQVAVGVVIFVLLLGLALFTRDRRFYFFLSISFLAVIPIASAEIQERNMLFVGIAACPVLAKAILLIWRTLRASTHKIKRLVLSVFLILLLSGHILLSALIMLPMSYAPKLVATPAILGARSLPEDITGQFIVSLGMPLFDAGFLTAIRWAEQKTFPSRFWNVSTKLENSSITRIDDNHWLVKRDLGLLGGVDFLLRDQHLNPIQVGERHDLGGMFVEVKAVNSHHVPTQLLLTRYEVAMDDMKGDGVDSVDSHIYYWEKQRLIPLTLAVGEIRSF